MRLRKNWLEWSVFAIGTVIIVTAAAVLIRSALRSGDAPARLEVRFGAPVAEEGRYRVPVVIENHGDATAANALVAVELREGENVVERTEIAFAFIPRNAKREGSVVFTHNPACCRLAVGAIGFETP